jgi:hypothetical protein
MSPLCSSGYMCKVLIPWMNNKVVYWKGEGHNSHFVTTSQQHDDAHVRYTKMIFSVHFET